MNLRTYPMRKELGPHSTAISTGQQPWYSTIWLKVVAGFRAHGCYLEDHTLFSLSPKSELPILFSVTVF